MRIEIDRTRCQGHGMCEPIIPDLVKVGDDAIAEPLEGGGDRSGPEDIQLAVDSCPAAAIRLV